jgi:hypothetical protein
MTGLKCCIGLDFPLFLINRAGFRFSCSCVGRGGNGGGGLIIGKGGNFFWSEAMLFISRFISWSCVSAMVLFDKAGVRVWVRLLVLPTS